MIPPSATVCIIANPMAGRRRRIGVDAWIRSLPPGAFHVTEYAGHAEELARAASLRGCDRIVALGGDGTIHEVLNGMLSNPENQSVLGIVAGGTANDYERCLRATLQREGAPVTLAVDVGVVTWEGGCRYFANVMGVGFSGRVATRARQLKRLPARLRYTWSVLEHFGPSFQYDRVGITMDDGMSYKGSVLMLSAAIGSHEGSYPLHPEADLTDGQFEVLSLGTLSRSEIIRYFPAMLRGRLPVGHPQVHRSRTCELQIESERPLAIHLDGEWPKGLSEGGVQSIRVCIARQSLFVYRVNASAVVGGCILSV